MPNRILRPWTDSEAVNSLDDAGEVFFVRLIQCADDYGRFYGSPQLLKSYLYPLKDKRVADISRLLAACVKAGLIADYEVSGKRYIEIKNFGQRCRATNSRFPAPPTNDSQMTVKCQSNDSHMTARDGDERREAKDGDGSVYTRLSHYSAPTPATEYPSTVDEVLAIAASPQCGVKMTREAAEVYLMKRLTTDWIDGCGRKIKRVEYDIKQWALRDQQNQADKLKAKVEMPPDDTDEEFAKNYHGDI